MAPPSVQQDTALAQYLTQAGQLPEDVLLGRIVLFTILDQGVLATELENLFTRYHLDPKLLPPPIRTIDAFSKATSEAKESYALNDGRTATVLCREVVKNKEYTRRQITREIRDNKRKRLEYSAGLTCTYHVGAQRLQITLNSDQLLHGEKQHMEAIAADIQRRFNRYCDTHDGDKIRAVVRNYLRRPLNAVEIKGGVYFVHYRHDDELQRLTQMVHEIGCQIHAIPIVNLASERAFIAQAFEAQASAALHDLAREARLLTEEGRKITANLYDKFKERFDDVMLRAEEHIVALEVDQDLTAASAEVAIKALELLKENVK